MDIHTARILSLCSGGGGLDLGVRLALPTARVVCYVEIDAYACAVLAARMEDKALDEAPVWSDLRTFDGQLWRGVVDLVIAGFPCQPWSTAGRRRGTADERWLWDDIARIVREIEPRWVFLENVPGLVRGGLEHVLRDLALCGFDAEWDCFSAAQVGASHIRERLFILAHANCNGLGWQWGLDELPETRQVALWHDADGRGREGQSVADAEGQRCKALEWGELRRDGQSAPVHCSSGDLFPPRPNDADGWRRAIEADPSVEPAICRLAYGYAEGLEQSEFAYRTDELRILGNGVVPLAAATALTLLWHRLVERRKVSYVP